MNNTFSEEKERVFQKVRDIIENEYIYSVDNIVDMLKIQRVYIQKEFCSNMDNLGIDTSFKQYIKAICGDFISYVNICTRLELSKDDYDDFLDANKDLLHLLGKANLNTYKLSRRILISKKELRRLILAKFKFELIINGQVEYFPLTSHDADVIMRYGLATQGDLMDYYNVKTELQVYRRLSKPSTCVIRKYVILSGTPSKKGMARYLLDTNMTPFEVEQVEVMLDI